MYAIVLYASYFDANKVQWQFSFSNFNLDILGAVVPLFIGLGFAVIYFARKGSKLLFFVCFLLSIVVAFFTGQPVSNGLIGNPAEFSYYISMITIFLVFLFSFLKDKTWKPNKKFYVSSLLVALSCSPLSLIVADLFYVPLYLNPTIGGNGLADEVLLSIMYAPLTVTFICAFILFIIQSVSAIKLRIDKTRCSEV